MRGLLTAAAFAVVIAGCFSNSQGNDNGDSGLANPDPFPALVPPKPDFDFATVIDPDHAGHHIGSLHTRGHGLKLVGHTGVQEILPATTRGSITAVDIWGDYAVVSGMEGGLAFVIVDISKPQQPKAIGWAPSAADGWTARFSADGNYVFYGCQMVGTTATQYAVMGTCEDPQAIRAPGQNPSGVSAWDVSDKTKPKFLHFLAVGGSHNIYRQTIDGVDYIFTASTAIVKFDVAEKKLVKVAEVPGRHDQSVVKHPITGDWLLFVGTRELTIWNVNDPADPQLVYEPAAGQSVPWTGWHDQVLVPGIVDGRVILLLAGESAVGTGGESLPNVVSVVDLTNPTDPVMLSQWQPPFRPLLPWAQYQWSIHEMSATPTGQVAVAWYHAGVWVIDVSTQERQMGPVTLAVYQPNKDINVLPSTFVQTPAPLVPMVWAAGWKADGHLVVPDMHTGLYILEPTWGLHPALDSGQ
jgi:hypothetical protein